MIPSQAFQLRAMRSKATRAVLLGTTFMLFVWLLTTILFSAVSVVAAASDEAKLLLGSSRVRLDGTDVSLDNPVRLRDGAVWTPLRSLAAALGAVVHWDPNLRRATVQLEDRLLEFTAGSATARLNGAAVTLPSPVFIERGRMQVPVRALAEGLGLQATYDATASRVVLLRSVGGVARGELSYAGATIVRSYDHPELGPVLVDGNGRVLYVFTPDEEGVSNCYGTCEENWPVLEATGEWIVGGGVTGSLGVTVRNDGTRQVTYDGMPLYYFAGDQAPGEANGQGINGVWFVANPRPESVTPATIDVANHPELGAILVDTYGRTLYMFVPDEPDVSNCYGVCEDNWPVVRGNPEPAGDVDIAIGRTQRNDGSDQVTINRMPVYYFVNDRRPGDAVGQGVNDVWYVLAPDGTVIGPADE